tara:strand:- start:2167 stop:2454 length:288 start_codon:yes stop_codon:yes gene_type:complete
MTAPAWWVFPDWLFLMSLISWVGWAVILGKGFIESLSPKRRAACRFDALENDFKLKERRQAIEIVLMKQREKASLAVEEDKRRSNRLQKALDRDW